MIAFALGASLFAFSGYVGVLLGLAISDRLERFTDGPPVSHPPIPWIVAGCAAIGAIVASRAAAPLHVLTLAVIAVALVAVWITDARRGIVPDLFTLGPLAVILLAAVAAHHWSTVFSAALPFVPFAAAAALSHGRGMGWGDAKLVALGGALLGAETATLAFSGACLAAALIHYARGERTRAIAFAPYLVTAIGIAIPFVVAA